MAKLMPLHMAQAQPRPIILHPKGGPAGSMLAARWMRLPPLALLLDWPHSRRQAAPWGAISGRARSQTLRPLMRLALPSVASVCLANLPARTQQSSLLMCEFLEEICTTLVRAPFRPKRLQRALALLLPLPLPHHHLLPTAQHCRQQSLMRRRGSHQKSAIIWQSFEVS